LRPAVTVLKSYRTKRN